MIVIVGYGLGNISAFANIYKQLGVPLKVANTRDDLKGAEKIILPGVGAFDWAMSLLNESGMRPVLEDLVMDKKVPVLGVCVGMQILAERSDEGELDGLGWIRGEVKKFRSCQLSAVGCRPSAIYSAPDRDRLPLPHMGWNDVVPRGEEGLFKGIERDSRFYFLHSYYFEPENSENVMAVTDYGEEFTSGVRSGNVYGVQFHPEKSHGWGIQLLKNFAEM